MIKGMLLDYGGTIDTNGRHWANVLWEGYQKNEVPISYEQFREAYVYAERVLAREHYVKPMHDFEDLLQIKCAIQADYLFGKKILTDWKWKPIVAEKVAQFGYELARITVESAKPVLETISTHYPICLVTNFYGNIEAVLEDFGLRRYFSAVVESAVEGCRKPDPRIFEIGAKRLKLKSNECVVVGDSMAKDIVPAQSIGCETIWLKGEAWDENELENKAQMNCLTVISGLEELCNWVINK